MSIFSRASTDCTVSSLESLGFSSEASSLHASDQESKRPELENTLSGTLAVRKSCRYDCFCHCHTQNQSSSKLFLSPRSSRLPCNDPYCLAVTSSEKLTKPPSSFFRNMLSQMMTLRSIKTQYNLKTFRMVSEGAAAIRHVKHGDLDRLKLCIESGEATLWDTAPDGWSLLHVSLITQIMSTLIE